MYYDVHGLEFHMSAGHEIKARLNDTLTFAMEVANEEGRVEDAADFALLLWIIDNCPDFLAFLADFTDRLSNKSSAQLFLPLTPIYNCRTRKKTDATVPPPNLETT